MSTKNLDKIRLIIAKLEALADPKNNDNRMERAAAGKRAASLRKKYLSDDADLSDLTDERVRWIVEYVVNSPAGPGYMVRGQMKDMEEMIGALLRAPGLHPEVEVVENKARLITEIQSISGEGEEK